MSHGVRRCPACQTGFILAEDKHVCWEVCLGPEHTLLTLSSPDACARLAPDERGQRADAAAALADDDDLTFNWDVCSVEEALNFF